MSQIIGFAAEAHAKQYLIKQGLRFVTNNFHSRFGELDLIMKDSDCLVFIEVRARTSRHFGGALASISRPKQQKIMKTAYYYLQVNQLQDRYPLRFDVVSIEGVPPETTWIKNAFGTDF